jgi:hypothetical protein
MAHRKRLTRLLLIALTITALAIPASALRVTKELVQGITLTQDISTDAASPMIVNVLTVDMANAAVDVRASIARDTVMTPNSDKGRETISSIVGRGGVIAGVNADYFPFTGDPLGICISNGELVSEPAMGRVAIGVTRERAIVFDNPKLDAKMTLPNGISRQIDGINRPRETNQVVVYTPTYGASTLNKYKAVEVVCKTPDLPVQPGKALNLTVSEVCVDAVNTPIPEGGVVISAGGPAAYFIKENLKPGDGLTIQLNLKSFTGIDWAQVAQAVGGGPWLVKDGNESIDNAEQGFAPAFAALCHPRTAVGVTADNKLLMVTVDGRQIFSAGMSLKSLAALMLKLGAVNAINLDGGGSTTMSIRGTVVNSPSEGIERPVANALVVDSRLEIEEIPKLRISGIDEPVPAGQPSQLFITWGDDHQMLTTDQLANVVWGTNNGIGFVNQQGYFIPMKARKGTIRAAHGTQVASLDVTVVGGPLARLEVRLAADALDPRRATFDAVLNDAFGNKLAGSELAISATGGTPDVTTGITDEKGVFSTGITWEPNAMERAARASIGEVEATAIYVEK